MKLVRDRNVLSNFDKKIIKDVDLKDQFPYYWNCSQVSNDTLPYLAHTLVERQNKKGIEMNRLTDYSSHTMFFINIVKKFCIKNKIPIKKIFRSCINLTWSLPEKEGVWHTDHNFKHRQFLMHLTETDAGTLLKKGKKIIEIPPVKYEGICFEGLVKHKVKYCSAKYRRRVMFVTTFI